MAINENVIGSDSFQLELKRVLETRIKEYAEDLAVELVKDFGQKLHREFSEITSSVSLELFSMMTMERSGSDLRIIIKLPEPK